jgi:TolB-like protein
VLRSGNKVRITAQLIEASTDKHLWSPQKLLSDLEKLSAIRIRR